MCCSRNRSKSPAAHASGNTLRVFDRHILDLYPCSEEVELM